MKIVAMHCTHMFPEQRHRIYACVCVRGAQPCVILCNPMDYSPSESPVNGIYPSRILEYLYIYIYIHIHIYIYIYIHTHTHTYIWERERKNTFILWTGFWLWGWANMKQTRQGGLVEAWTDFFSSEVLRLNSFFGKPQSLFLRALIRWDNYPHYGK